MIIRFVPRVTAEYGAIDSVHKTPHTGIDAAVPIGTKIYAPEGGIVSRIADYGDTSLGKAVFIKTKTGHQYIVGHLSEVNPRIHEGDRVFAGDYIALSGNSGNSTGPHVHIGVIDKTGAFVDPSVVSHDSQLGILGRMLQRAWTDAHESARAHASSLVYDFVAGTLDGLRDLVVDYSYAIALLGGGAAIILHTAGWRDGTRWAGMLAVGFVLIRYLLR